MHACIHMPCNRVQPPLTSKYMHITPMKTMYRCVCFSIPILHVHIHYMTELAPTCRQLLAFLIPYTSMPCINNIPLPPLPLQVFPSPQHNSNWDPDPIDIISLRSSSDSPLLPPLQCSACKSKIQTPQFMAHPCTVPPA